MTITVPDDFQYLPLNEQYPSFRLLRLRKGNQAAIECDIFHQPISSHRNIEYEALSYAWGSNELVDQVQINGQRLWVSENAFVALSHLRLPDQDRILWIDAICIDQTNDKEKSQQVREMGNIFNSARQVVFWLGKPTAEITLLMTYLNALQAHQDSSIDLTTCWKIWSDRSLGLQNNDKDSLSHQRKGLQTLFKRPWFERVWVIQEVANSQSAIVQSGAFQISSDIFALTPTLLDIHAEPHVRSILEIMPSKFNHYLEWGRRRRSLVDLLEKYRTSKASDERDRIFALHSLSHEPPDHVFLYPDYTKSFPEVICNVLRYWFESTFVHMSQVIEFLVSFKTLQTVCLVSTQRKRAEEDAICLFSRYMKREREHVVYTPFDLVRAQPLLGFF